MVVKSIDYLGYRSRRAHAGRAKKTEVVEREGKIRSFHVANVTARH